MLIYLVILTLITKAQCIARAIKNLLQCNRLPEFAEVDLIIKGDISSQCIGIIERNNRSRDVLETLREILLLPLPPDTVKVCVMEIEERIYSLSIYLIN